MQEHAPRPGLVRIRDVASTFVRADPATVAAAIGPSTREGERLRVEVEPGSVYLIEAAPGGARVVHARTAHGVLRNLRFRFTPEEFHDEVEADLARIKRLVERTEDETAILR